MAISILTPHNSCNLNTTDTQNLAELELGLTGDPYDNLTATRTNRHLQRGFELILYHGHSILVARNSS